VSGTAASPFRQPKAVFAVAFACVVSFMGIGLVDPILPAISHQLHASPSEVTLLFTSYLVVTAVAMLITNWVSSRLGAKKTLIAGLILIVVFSALAGASPTINQIIGFRAGWGVGNALFIATSLAVIVASASGGFAGAIVLYETALGIGIAVGPLLGGTLGEISWRGPFYGVAVLMAIALIATVVLVEPTPKPAHKTGLSAPLRALRHRGLLTLSLTALCYNWGFFTVLGYAPFPMELSPIRLGLVFFGWGIFVAIFAVFGAPRLQARLGIARTMYLNLAAFAVVVLVIAIWTTDRAVLIPAVIVSGIFIGVNNTITTQAAMTVSPVEKPVASAAYSFVRFIGGGLAPYAAGRLVLAINIHVPFFIAAGALVLGIVILSTARGLLTEAERVQAENVAENVAGTASARTVPAETGPAAPALIPVAGGAAAPDGAAEIILAAIDRSPMAPLVTETAARLASADGRAVYVVHAQEDVTASDTAVDGENLEDARALVRNQLDLLAAHHVPAQGHVLRHAPGHGVAGRMVAEYAASIGASTIVIGAPSHGGLPALMDDSASRELWRHARSNILIVNPDAPGIRAAADEWRELASLSLLLGGLAAPAADRRSQVLGQVFQRGQRGGQGGLLLGGQAGHAFGQDRGSLRRDALKGLFPFGGGLDAGGAEVVGVTQAADQAKRIKLADHAGQHGRVEALDLGEFGEAERAAVGDDAEHGCLRRGQPLPHRGRVQLPREPQDDPPETDNGLLVHAHSPPPLLCAGSGSIIAVRGRYRYPSR
jgi:MFS transporter, ACDE family, multidrug resistance protein